MNARNMGGLWMAMGLAACLIPAAACSPSEKGAEAGGEGAAPTPAKAPAAYETKEGDRVVHTAKGSGRWFPDNRKELEAMVAGYIREAKAPKVEGRIVGAIAPHAGYVYSGKVAGYAFRALADAAAAGQAPETVVILGLSHRGGFRGVALMDGDAIQTPLGETKLDKEAGDILVKNSGGKVVFQYGPHGGEHSAENEIPFVQAALPKARLVVGLIGDHDEKTLAGLVGALGELAKRRKILVVASTDLLHDADYDLVTRTDKATMEKIGAMDHAGLAKTWDYSKQICCGIGPVLAVMRFAEAQGCKKGTVLCYRNSGDDFPESRGNWVVGYGAAVFTAPEGEK